MASSKEIRVVVVGKVKTVSPSGKTDSQEKLPDTTDSTVEPSDNGGNGYYGGGNGENRSPITSLSDTVRHIFKPVSVIASTKSIMDTMQQALIYGANYYLRAKNDYQGQQNINIAANILQKGMSTGLMVMGSWSLGPVAGVMATIVAGAKIGFDIYKNYNEQNFMLEQQQTELDYSRVRAGFSLTGGSIGEDK